jgi:hypothetical protein
MNKDLYPVISFKGGVNYTAAHDGDAIVDMQGYEEALILIQAETLTDGGFTFELKEGDNSALSDAAAAADADLVGGGPTAGALEPTFAATDDDTSRWFYYKGNKRYLRIDLKTVTGSPSTGGMFIATVVRMKARHLPVV